MQIKYNRTRRTAKIRYIVIHDTGNTSRGADARAHLEYFNSAPQGSSADIFIDESGIYIANDYNKYYTWHCGDGGGSHGITNQNSVGIELCVNSDGNYAAAFDNTVIATRRLMSELSVTSDRVVRHYDASRKLCPASMSQNDWTLWKEFKHKIAGGLSMSEYEELKREIELLKANSERVYHYGDELPDWAVPTVQKLIDKGIYRGESEGDLNLPETLLRTLVISDRAGLYD